VNRYVGMNGDVNAGVYVVVDAYVDVIVYCWCERD